MKTNERDKSLIQAGIDIWMIRDNLKLSFEERATQHQNTLDMINDLQNAKIKDRAKPSSPSQTINS